MATKRKLEFRDLPSEVYILIAKQLELVDLLALTRTNCLLKKLLASDFDREIMRYGNEEVGSVLHLAAERGQISLAKLALQRGISVSFVDAERRTPLHTAAINGKVDVAKLLLKWGANIEAGDRFQKAPLWLAAMNMQSEVVKCLLEEGADVNHRRGHYLANNILISTFRAFNSFVDQEQMRAVVRHLLHTSPEPLKRIIPDHSAMFMAMKHCCTVVVPILLEAGADFPSKHSIYDNVKDAIAKRSDSKVRYLLELGKDMDFSELLPTAAQYCRPSTFRLMYARKVSQPQQTLDICLARAVIGIKAETIKFLLSVGAKCSARCCLRKKSKGSVLHRALFIRDNGGIAHILIKAGCDLNAKDTEGRSPLSWAIFSGCMTAHTVQMLLDAGANALEIDENGETLLHKAITADLRGRRTEKVDETALFTNVGLLLQHGVDINRRDNHGFTALHYAVQLWSKPVIEFLIRSGADPTVKPDNGQSLVDLVGDGRNEVKRLKPIKRQEVLEYVAGLEREVDEKCAKVSEDSEQTNCQQ